MKIPSSISSVYKPYQGNAGMVAGMDSGINSDSATKAFIEPSVRSDNRIAPENPTGQKPPEQNPTTEDPKASTETKPSSDPTDKNLQLTPEELRLVEELKQTDLEVRQHEMAHLNAGGAYVTSGATFTYQQGPDGQKYAVGGEVGIDVSPVPGDPQATLRKMKQVRNAALAPANPSAQDLKVAANASSQAVKALSDLTLLQAKQQAAQRETQAFGNNRQEASQAYTRVKNLPETETATFQLAV